MRFGVFHKKKKNFLNRLKIYLVGILFFYRKREKVQCFKSAKSVVIIHNNKKLGDLIVFSAAFREFKTRAIEITVITDPQSALFLADNNNIDDIIVKKSDRFYDLLKLMFFLHKRQYDIILDPFETMPDYRHAMLMLCINSSFILGYDKWYSRYYDIYDRHNENLTEHISTRVRSIFSYFSDDINGCTFLNYDLPIHPETQHKIQNYLDSKKLILINPFGAKKICRLSEEQIISTYQYLKNKFPSCRIVFTGVPKEINRLNIPDAEISPFQTFNETIALTKQAYLLVSVDTALIHVATAFHTPTVALYPKARRVEYPSVVIWGPNNAQSVLAVSPGYYVNELPVQNIKNAIDTINDNFLQP